jgi:anaerobic selenocysteine-containing dehydrogenase
MSAEQRATERIPGYCALCISRCGSTAVIEDGRFIALEPDPSRPTGQALCAKGRAAPELVYHLDRLLYPLRRTRPKGDPDPGWERIGWDEALRERPGGVRVPLEVRHRKYTEVKDGVPTGFATPTGRAELYSETILEHGYPPLPEHVEPLVGPHSRPDLAGRYPLILTCAKSTQFCQSQHRALPSLRRKAPDPEVELHPAAAAAPS